MRFAEVKLERHAEAASPSSAGVSANLPGWVAFAAVADPGALRRAGVIAEVAAGGTEASKQHPYDRSPRPISLL
jgi:hypothetical protein